MNRTFSTLLALLPLFPLGAGCAGTPSDPLPAPPAAEGFQLAMDVDSPPGAETWKCQIAPLAVDELQNVHRVKHLQSKAVHHMDVMVILYSGLNLPPGTYDCAPLYAANPKLMEETILYASQNESGEIVLPPGIAAKVPGGLTLMYELHHVNATSKPVHLFSRINAYTMPHGEVTGSIWGHAVRDRNLNIPPGADHTEWSRCTVDKDVDVLFLSTHTHELGVDASIFAFDGHATGEELFRNHDWQSPPLKAFTQPHKLRAGEGFEFRCHYLSNRDDWTRWGFEARDEMCNMALVFTPGDADVKCKVVETSDGMIVE
jgi:hypothetical protein